MNDYMGRVRLVIGDGMCEHYKSVEYVKKMCPRCSMFFLACPKCNPTYCPDCIRERARRKKKANIEIKLKGMRWIRQKKRDSARQLRQRAALAAIARMQE